MTKDNLITEEGSNGKKGLFDLNDFTMEETDILSSTNQKEEEIIDLVDIVVNDAPKKYETPLEATISKDLFDLDNDFDLSFDETSEENKTTIESFQKGSSLIEEIESEKNDQENNTNLADDEALFADNGSQDDPFDLGDDFEFSLEESLEGNEAEADSLIEGMGFEENASEEILETSDSSIITDDKVLFGDEASLKDAFDLSDDLELTDKDHQEIAEESFSAKGSLLNADSGSDLVVDTPDKKIDIPVVINNEEKVVEPTESASDLIAVSEEKLEVLITRIVQEVTEKVARETMNNVAEKFITEAIEVLKESVLKDPL